jgi:hypothetical protein
MARRVVPLLAAALLLPSANLQVLDGIPLGTLPEFAVLALLVPLVASRALRRLHARALRHAGARGTRAILVALVAAIGLKLGLLVAGPDAGFIACYRTPVAPPPGGRACERAFENPFARFAATRIDRAIDFAPGTWDLGFVNSLRFNFYRQTPAEPRRDRLPLAVTWRGEIDGAGPWVARLTYVGEVTVTIGPAETVLPGHYGLPRQALVPVPAGRHALTLQYRFDDGARTDRPAPPFPAATLRLLRERAGGGETSVEAARPALAWRVAAAIADGCLGLALVPLVLVHVRLLAPAGALLVLVAGAALASLPGVGRPGWLPRGGALLLPLAVLVVTAAVRPRPRLLLAAYVAAVAAGVLAAGREVPALRTVLLRSGGDDWLTHESHARTILETGSLQGGENVFYHVPLYRYVRFAQRLLLGDGDLLVLAAGLAALGFAVVWMVARLGGPATSRRGTAGLAVVGLLVLVLVTSPPGLRAVQLPLSEPAAWTALLLLFPLLAVPRTARAGPVGAGLAGLAAGIRPNLAPALAALVGLFVLAAPRRRRALAAAAGFALVAALPLAHNLHYGRRVVLATTSGGVAANLTLPPLRLLGLATDGAIRAQAWIHLRRLVVPEPSADPALAVAMHGLQAAWLGAALVTLACWRRTHGASRLLLLWPLTVLGVQFFYDTPNYYPRHLVASYLALGLVAAQVAGSRGRRR